MRPLLQVGDLLLDRFVVDDAPLRQQPSGRDRSTGARVVFLERWVELALDRVALRGVARLDLGREDPRIARTLATDPVIVACEAERPLAPAVAADALIAMLELTAELAPRGVAPDILLARVPVDGSADVCVPAVPADTATQFFMPEHHRWAHLWTFAAWARSHGVAGPDPSLAGPSLRDFARLIAPHATDAARAIQRANGLPDRLAFGALAFDIDEAIAECARDLEACKPGWEHECLTWGLAAALHRRACMDASAWSADLDRAIALDAHPSYLTTQALLRERDGDARACASHDAAVDALEWSVPVMTGPITMWQRPSDPPDRARRDAARTLTARAAFRVKRGDREGARADLTRAASYEATEQVRRWLAWLDR